MNDIEADLLIANAKIKQLEEQLADYHHMSELVDGKMEENQRLRRINENLTARAEKAEAELKIVYELADNMSNRTHEAVQAYEDWLHAGETVHEEGE